MNAIGFVVLILAFLWLGTWALQIAALGLVIAARVIVVAGLALFGVIGCAFLAVTDPDRLRRELTEDRSPPAPRDRWA